MFPTPPVRAQQFAQATISGMFVTVSPRWTRRLRWSSPRPAQLSHASASTSSHTLILLNSQPANVSLRLPNFNLQGCEVS
jgi:hypothetical protein